MAEMHARTFLCREALWQQFEEIAREQGASMDDVLADAMRAYARQRQYGGDAIDEGHGGSAPPGAHDYDRENAPDLARTNAVRPVSRRPPPMPPPPSRGGGGGLPLPPPPAGRSARPMTQPLPPTPPPRQRPGMPGGGAPLAPPSRGMSGGGGYMPPPASVPPPPPRGSARNFPSSSSATQDAAYNMRPRGAPRLTLSYEGQHVEVVKERFILGRSKTQADLVLEDPNVSRQHAAIEREGNEWVLVDLGSTNGCYVDGARVSRRPLEDGDIIEVTTHQVRCTLG